jgi:medium-chain acyl-[acyl-carrier-protein] hydrolase
LAGSLVKAWFPYWRPKPGARLRLFCFPFAGGGASQLHRWAELDPSVEVLAVQYPGRETRFGEPPFRQVPALIEALGPVLTPLLDVPFALFGYSLGTYLCLELARWLQRVGAPAPLGLMLAAGVPPESERERSTHTLPDEDFLRKVQSYGGIPPEVLAHQELLQLVLPIMRADYEMVGGYTPAVDPPLPIPFAVWGGAEDTAPAPGDLERWRKFTSSHFALEILPGGHFFFRSAGDKLRKSVERTLSEWSAGTSGTASRPTS